MILTVDRVRGQKVAMLEMLRDTSSNRCEKVINKLNFDTSGTSSWVTTWSGRASTTRPSLSRPVTKRSRVPGPWPLPGTGHH